jgi:hypothetical protein
MHGTQFQEDHTQELAMLQLKHELQLSHIVKSKSLNTKHIAVNSTEV